MPMVVGHEFVGEVAELGSSVTGYRLCIDDFQEGFAAMKSGNSGKVVPEW